MSPSRPETVSSLVPRLKEDLTRLVAIPSLSEWGFPEHTHAALLEAHEQLVELLRDAGVEQLDSISLPGTAPVVTSTTPVEALAARGNVVRIV